MQLPLQAEILNGHPVGDFNTYNQSHTLFENI